MKAVLQTPTTVPGIDARVSHALASATSGRLVSSEPDDPLLPQLHVLAAAAPELIEGSASNLELLCPEAGPGEATASCREVLIVSGEFVHVVVPLGTRPDAVLLTVSSGAPSIGIVLAAVRAKLAELESG